MKLLTVCIPCYNSIMEMHKAINSCLLMKDEVEVLIVDRHSHDETLQVAREYEEAYPDTVKVITTKEDVPFLKTALKYREGLYYSNLRYVPIPFENKYLSLFSFLVLFLHNF